MATIISSASFNPADFSAPGLYINNVPPVPYINGAATNVGFVVGTANWGPVNAPLITSDPADAQNKFGGITATALTDVHDLCTDLTIAYQQGFINLWGVRVTDGTDVAASVTASGATASGGTVTALYTGSLGNEITFQITAGSNSNLFNVYVSAPFYGNAEAFTNLPAATFWTSLQTALASGVNGVRGPSSLVRLLNASNTAGAPTVGIYTLAGGTSGSTNVVTDDLIGQNQTTPHTGIYLAASLSPYPQKMWVAGLTDSSAVADMVAFAQANAIFTVMAFPTGTSTSAAQAAIEAAGEPSYELSWLKDWIYWNDPVNATVRLVAPYGFTMGLITALSPAQSPLNKQVLGVVGTERNNPYTGNVPYGNTEIGIMNSIGVLVITNPIPQGAVFGIATATNTSTNSAESPVEYAAMTNFLDISFGETMGQFVGQLQTARPSDPLRASVRHALNGFLNGLQGAGIIDAFSVVCTYATSGNPQLGVNTPQTIAQHYLYAFAAVRYLSSVWYFVISLQGGTTVVTTSPAQSA